MDREGTELTSQLTSSLESTPYAFYIATGSAGTIALLIWIYGYRVLRRVRRVALSDKSSSRRHIVWEDAISRLPQTDPLTGLPRTISPWTARAAEKCAVPRTTVGSWMRNGFRWDKGDRRAERRLLRVMWEGNAPGPGQGPGQGGGVFKARLGAGE